MPVGLRYDRVTGNNYIESEVLWNIINNPINISTFMGNDSFLSTQYIIRRELELIREIKAGTNLIYFGLPNPIILGKLSTSNIFATFFMPGTNANDIGPIHDELKKYWKIEGHYNIASDMDELSPSDNIILTQAAHIYWESTSK